MRVGENSANNPVVSAFHESKVTLIIFYKGTCVG